MWNALVETLEPRVRSDLEARMTPRSFDKGRTVVREGDTGKSMAVIDRGHVLAERVTLDGDIAAVAVLGPDSLVGELALVADEVRGATVRALTPVEMRFLPGLDFAELRRSHPALDQMLITLLQRRVVRLTDLVMEARHSTLEYRVHQQLTILGELFDGDIPLTQATLASLTGGTRPTVNSILQNLVAAGAVELRRGHIIVKNPDAIGLF
ncbi:MAG: Crp/Fnr family transcriptional regulator [Acidimicrobiales bacterium]|nr:Crp/Fnr family transcriptional regulator [Acidimicrobiales bacterium]